jgi:hypothetical protein
MNSEGAAISIANHLAHPPHMNAAAQHTSANVIVANANKRIAR